MISTLYYMQWPMSIYITHILQKILQHCVVLYKLLF